MINVSKATLLVTLPLVLISCATPISEPAQTPTLEPIPTPSSELTQTPLSPTETGSISVLPSPSGDPVAEWEGIPVMPSAIAGDGDGNSYIFMVNATADQVQLFYEAEMIKMGWNLFAIGQGATDAVMLIFMKDTDMLTVSILPQFDGLIYVMFVK